ncbi:MAG TPA: pilus assembly protein TadG-related protein [Candidatus Dormibacteraeota bacterium]|nr:pilus assembly protein TadG-related protein [Candidatus Dormibacteraeota bacterium]
MRSQSGQSIVLVGLMIVVLFGFVGLAMDGGRGYLDRRSMQAGVDAAALAAAYNYMNNTSYDQAETAATTVFANNQRLYTAPTCSGYGSLSATCSFGDSTNQVLTITVVNRSIAGVTFTATATHSVPVTMMQVVGAGPTMSVGATATAVARRSGTFGAAIQTLSPGTCNGGTTSLSFNGTSTTLVTGDVWSNGSIIDSGTPGGSVTGNVIDVCPNMPPLPLTSPNWTVTGSQTNGFNNPDPGYAMPSLNPTSQSWNMTTGSTESPGTYAADPKLAGSAGCYFLAGGVYDFAAGFSDNGGFVSNEIRPPDEPLMASVGTPVTTTLSASIAPTNNQTTLPVPALTVPIPIGAQAYISNTVGQIFTLKQAAAVGDTVLQINKATVTGTLASGSIVTFRSPNQFWDANNVGCSSTFALSSPGSGSLSGGTYSVEVTAVRWAPNGVASCTGPASPTCFRRESAPSMCKTLTVASSGNLKVDVTADPGVTDFNIYVANNASCSGLTYCAHTGNGSLTQTIPSCAASTVVPPDGEGMPLAPGLPNADPGAGTPPHGDLANEKHCVDPTTGNDVACPGAWTPGAIEIFIPGPGSNQQCLNLQGGGDMYVYSGYQLQRVLFFEPGPEQSGSPNNCPNKVAGHGLTSLIGIFYIPAANVTIIGNSSYLATIAGGVVAWTASVQGNGGVSITADPSLRAFPSTVRLTQ